MESDRIINKTINLKTEHSDSNITVSVKDHNFIRLDLIANEDNILEAKEFEKMIKNSEQLVRSSDCYKHVKHVLIEEYGLNHCMYYKNITVDVDKLEMHHGPIFTLYDLCEIAAICILKRNTELTVFRIKRLVLLWHLENIVQLMILSKNVHDAAHLNSKTKGKQIKSMFLDHRSAFGDLATFISEYYRYFNIKHIMKIKRYLDEYSHNIEKEDKESLYFKEVLKKWEVVM